MAPPSQLVFPIVVWGDNYIDTFLQLALPTFLAAENLPYCASKIRTKLILISDVAGIEKLRASGAVDRAGQICEVELKASIEIPTSVPLNKYHVMAAAHHDVIKSLQGVDAVVGILSPDCLINNGCLKFALDKILSGFDSVLAAGPRAGLRGVRQELMNRAIDGALALNSRELVGILCRHFHPISRSVMFSERNFTTMPSCLYWMAADNSFVARYFHLHPLMVKIRPAVRFPDQHRGTVDATLIDDADVTLATSYVCENSDELVIVEVTDENVMHIHTRMIIFKSVFIYRWSKAWANARHVRAFLTYKFCFRGSDVSLVAATSRSQRDCRLLDRLLRRGLVEPN